MPPLILMIADGFGLTAPGREAVSAIAQGNTPVFDRLWAENPHTPLYTNGHYAGLPGTMMGNSEAGHMTIGAGREVPQIINMVTAALESGSFAEKPEIQHAIATLKKTGGAMHIAGILCDDAGAVHGHLNYLIQMAALFDTAGIPVWLHGFTDGRDTNPGDAKEFVATIEQAIAPLTHTRFATLGGRYYGMDRDKKWDRTELAFNAIVCGKGEHAASASDAVRNALAAGVTDEFILPTVIGDYQGMPPGKDGYFMTNHRPDRARQISAAITLPRFDGFTRVVDPAPVVAIGMTFYSPELTMPALFLLPEVKNSFADVLAAQGIKQLRVAETEKFNHVTSFFNGGKAEPVAGEERILIPSPKVATYDLQPEMSAQAVCDAVVRAIREGTYPVIIVNFANPDMVGHTGKLAAAVKAVEKVDRNLGEIEAALQATGGLGILIADHGNAEDMSTTKHTTGPVPFVLFGDRNKVKSYAVHKKTPGLADIAPTLLALLGIEKPQEMTGETIVSRCHETVT